MPHPIFMRVLPVLHLTHGQVAWAICDGHAPDPKTLDQLRYIRQLGIPFTDKELGVGRGNRLTYSYDHLIECGAAVWALRRGMRPRAVAEFLVGERPTLRPFYRKALLDQPAAALEAPWVKSRGTMVPTLEKDYALFLHKHYKTAGQHARLMTMEEVMTFKAGLGDLVVQVGHEIHPLVPLVRLAIQWVAWALVAPETRTGPRTE